MKKRLLIVARDPGPIALLKAVWPDLKVVYDLCLLIEDRSAKFIEWVPDTERLIIPVSEPCEQGCERALRWFHPDIVLRTTPAHGSGVDELIFAAMNAVRCPAPLFCIQDHYGIGQGLLEAHSVATVDAIAAKLVQEQYGVDAAVVGWAAHQHYVSGMPWIEARVLSRKNVGIGLRDQLILYAGICSGLSSEEDFRDFTEVVCALQKIENLGFAVAAKPHPRHSAATQALYFDKIHKAGLKIVDVSGLCEERLRLAVADVIISPASVMNIDALAYQAYWKAWHDNIGNSVASVYTLTESSVKAMKLATTGSLFPSHTVGCGSFIAESGRIEETIATALVNHKARQECLTQAEALYLPVANVGANIIAWLEGKNV